MWNHVGLIIQKDNLLYHTEQLSKISIGQISAFSELFPSWIGQSRLAIIILEGGQQPHVR